MWLIVAAIVGVSIFILQAQQTLPDSESITTRHVKESTKIYDKTGTKVLYDIYGEERRTVVKFDAIADSVKKATIAVEDARFYQHSGFDIYGFARSLLRNAQLGYGSGGGGSTITQQLVGNALVGRQKTLERKVQELILAIDVERNFSKDQILEMYLNQIPYGSNAYGIEAAAQTYFGIPASEVSIAQAATLAAMPQRPSYFSPYGSNTEELAGRKEYIINRMLELGLITQEEHTAAIQETITFKPKQTGIAAPHFVIMAREYVIQKYGQDIIEGGGFNIITTLDADLQAKAEELVVKYAKINATKYKATNAALVAIDPRTGDVQALVGSANYFDTEAEGNYNVALANRQPGSSFKPFAYAAAFEKGFTDSTILWDLRTEFNPLCSPDSTATRDSQGSACYHPQNYTGSYSGPVTMRQSLARSLNTTAVQTLYLAGINNTIDLATRMGITTLTDRSRIGLSLVLGGVEVRPIDMVSAYGVFANDGIRVPWGFIQRIENNDTILEERSTSSERVLSAQTARTMSDVLSDNNARAAAFGPSSSLVVPGYSVAVKTGTTQENRDAWVVGYSPTISVGVWAGNNRNQSMTAQGAGLSAAGPLWNEFITYTLRSRQSRERFINPNPVTTNKMMLNGAYISSEYSTPHSILFYVDKENPLGPYPENPANDPQFRNWEYIVQRHYPAIQATESPVVELPTIESPTTTP